MKMLSAIPRLPANDISESCKFYKDKLGFEVLHADEQYAILTFDRAELHLFKWSATDGVEKLIAESCRIRVEQVAKFYEKYKEVGVIHPNGHLQKQAWGDMDFTIVDIDNNAINFFE